MPETTIVDVPWAIQGATSPAGDARRQLSGLLVHDGSGVSAMPGLLHGMGMSGTALTATMAAGAAVVTPVVGQGGSYIVSSSGSRSVTLDARDATNSRRDLAVLRVRDPEISGSLRQGVLEVITGTPAASPSTPATPVGTLPLGYATVPPSGTVVWTDLRAYTSALGGTIPCTSTTRPSGGWLRPGQHIYETDTTRLWLWTSSAWLPVLRDELISTTLVSGTNSWAASDVAQWAKRDRNGMTHLYCELRAGAEKTVSSTGRLNFEVAANLQGSFLPAVATWAVMEYINGSTTYMGTVRIDTTGSIIVLSGTPNVNVSAQTAGNRSVRFSASYLSA